MQDDAQFPESLRQNTPVAKLIRYRPSGTLFARVRIKGKLIRRSLRTKVLSVGKLRLADLEKAERQSAEHAMECVGGKMIEQTLNSSARRSASSEFGMRKGNLVSCRARVELKVRNKATGQLLAVDRQTSVAVDVSEQIAGKLALQQAAAELAERVIPGAMK